MKITVSVAESESNPDMVLLFFIILTWQTFCFRPNIGTSVSHKNNMNNFSG